MLWRSRANRTLSRLCRCDYQALFNAAEGVTECFNQQQKNQFDVWMLHAVLANDLCTDDSFVDQDLIYVDQDQDQKKPGYVHQVLFDVATKFWCMCICFLIVCTLVGSCSMCYCTCAIVSFIDRFLDLII
ncbi:unnamed protein product [Triticum turgidum subsp. durum]|uniref:Uncharacterized protein n=1 Tax=Triticum turgidum subsp. durum TaxID=4567 RepID=A0A9R0Q8I8_TRITD|nr:unnamed protein product [Triticum turgidum subsp. durum]